MITNRLPQRRNLLGRIRPGSALISIGEPAAVLFLAQKQGLWPLALAVVVAIELWPLRPGVVQPAKRSRFILDRVPALLVGLGTVLIIAVTPRLASQTVMAVLLAGWRWWWSGSPQHEEGGLMNLLIVQAVAFEGVFLMAAWWRTPDWLIIGLVWLVSYLSVYAILSQRGERAAGVMAATWALVAAEISWVLLKWLFTYTVTGGYLLVPQPTLILTALSYCLGSIYVAQRRGTLSRGRLTEYLLIGLILIAIVITGTPWRGTL